jgi:hypothetical protein
MPNTESRYSHHAKILLWLRRRKIPKQPWRSRPDGEVAGKFGALTGPCVIVLKASHLIRIAACCAAFETPRFISVAYHFKMEEREKLQIM